MINRCCYCSADCCGCCFPDFADSADSVGCFADCFDYNFACSLRDTSFLVDDSIVTAPDGKYTSSACGYSKNLINLFYATRF